MNWGFDIEIIETREVLPDPEPELPKFNAGDVVSYVLARQRGKGVVQEVEPMNYYRVKVIESEDESDIGCVILMHLNMNLLTKIP